MAANTSPIFEATPWLKGAQLVNATGTTKTLLVSGGTNGSRIDMIRCSTNDTAAETLQFWAYDGATYRHLADVPLAAGAGYTTVPGVDAIATLSPTLGYLVVQSGWSIYVSVTAAVTSGDTTDIVAMGGDY
jgi:hypothetical protein